MKRKIIFIFIFLFLFTFINIDSYSLAEIREINKQEEVGSESWEECGQSIEIHGNDKTECAIVINKPSTKKSMGKGKESPLNW